MIFSVPRGVLTFAINACIDTLPSFTNLKRWGKRFSDTCPLCKGKGTLLHILNNCQYLLERYLWRHNNLIRILISRFKDSEEFVGGGLLIYADIGNNTVGGGTIPPNIIAVAQKPDIVLCWPSDERVILFELSVPFEPNIGKAHGTKLDRYASLVSNITDTGHDCSLIAFEVGSRDLIDTDNKDRLTRLSKLLSCRTKYKDLKNHITKSVVMSSYSIFTATHDPQWNVQEIL